MLYGLWSIIQNLQEYNLYGYSYFLIRMLIAIEFQNTYFDKQRSVYIDFHIQINKFRVLDDDVTLVCPVNLKVAPD